MRKYLLILISQAFYLHVAAQNVGVGTSTPVAKLHVNDSTATTSNNLSMMLQPNLNSGHGSYLKIGKELSTGNAADIFFQYEGSNSDASYLGLGFFDKPTPIRAYNNGKVIVGNSATTTIPGLTLQVSGTNGPYNLPALGVSAEASRWLYLHGSFGTSDHSLIWDNTSALRFGTEASQGFGYAEHMRITNAGNVGIGYQTPQVPLHTSGRIGLFDGSREWTIGAGRADGAGNGYPDAVAVSDGTFAIRDVWNQKDRLRINWDGNVGIGTTNPSTKLQVNPKVIDDNSIIYDNNALMVVHPTPTGNTLNDPKTSLILARQGLSGVAFGAAASFNLSRHEASNPWSRTRLDIQLANNFFLTDAPTVMTLLSNGNVGIGTVTPRARLGVMGGIALGNNAGGDAINTTWSERNSIQFVSTVGEACTDHTGALMYSTMPCAWGQASLNIAISTNWGTYNTTTPALRITQGATYVNGDIVLTSDRRLKSNIKDIEYGLDAVLKIKPMIYTKHIADKNENGELILRTGNVELGVIAQELNEIIPELVHKSTNEGKEFLGVNYIGLTPVLIKAIQEQQKIIEKLQTENNDLKAHSANEFNAIKAEIQYLKDALFKAAK